MITGRGRFFDGRSAQSHSVTVEWFPAIGQLLVRSGATVLLAAEREEIEMDPPLASTERVVRFANGACVYLETAPDLERALDGLHPLNRWVWWARLLEQSRWGILAALVAIGVIGYSFVRWGVPLLADVAAHHLPEEADRAISQVALDQLDDSFLRPSALPPDRHDAIRNDFNQLVEQADRPKAYPVQIVFRSCSSGPNAFALPDGTVIVTDELVNLATPEEIVAVLAHEWGHVAHRHGMRLVLRQTGLALLITIVLGDVASMSNLGMTLPLLLIQTGYSREFERDADAFAADILRQAGRDPVILGTILEKLERAHNTGDAFTWISTHPGTSERIAALSSWTNRAGTQTIERE